MCTAFGSPPERHVTFGKGRSILFDKIPVPTIELGTLFLGLKCLYSMKRKILCKNAFNNL